MTCAKCFVLDDTIMERPRSKKVELLSRAYDHVSHRQVKGFTNLLLAWTDGLSSVPVPLFRHYHCFQLLSIIRVIAMRWIRRTESDPATMGSIFNNVKDTLEDLPFTAALQTLL